jgi:hypothetical protein
LLQIADHCAFIAKRKLQKCQHVGKLYRLIEPNIAFKTLSSDVVSFRLALTDLEFLNHEGSG